MIERDPTTDQILKELAEENNCSEEEAEDMLMHMFRMTRLYMTKEDFPSIKWRGLGEFTPRMSYVKTKLRKIIHSQKRGHSGPRYDGWLPKLFDLKRRLTFEKAARSHKMRAAIRKQFKNSNT